MSFGTVTGTFTQNFDPLTGEATEGIPLANIPVTFTPSTPQVIFPDEIMRLNPVTCSTDQDGILTGPDGLTQIRLVSTTEGGNPESWTWRVSFLNTSFSFTLSDEETVDLSEIVPVPTHAGVEVPAWFNNLKQYYEDAVLALQEQAEVGKHLLDDREELDSAIDLTDTTRNLIIHGTLTQPLTVLLPPEPEPGLTITLELTQDSKGSHTLTIPNALTAYGVPITPTPDPNSLTEIMCFYDGIRWKARTSGLADSITTSWVVA